MKLILCNCYILITDDYWYVIIMINDFFMIAFLLHFIACNIVACGGWLSFVLTRRFLCFMPIFFYRVAWKKKMISKPGQIAFQFFFYDWKGLNHCMGFSLLKINLITFSVLYRISAWFTNRKSYIIDIANDCKWLHWEKKVLKYQFVKLE